MTIKDLRWMVYDSLTNAGNVASRCMDATEGTEELLAFEAIRTAIYTLRDEHPAMKKLTRKVTNELRQKL